VATFPFFRFERHFSGFYKPASRTADKELFIVPGATHIRTYFVEEYVDQISAKIQGFYTQKL
jgi:hypothetical protein